MSVGQSSASNSNALLCTTSLPTWATHTVGGNVYVSANGASYTLLVLLRDTTSGYYGVFGNASTGRVQLYDSNAGFAVSDLGPYALGDWLYVAVVASSSSVTAYCSRNGGAFSSATINIGGGRTLQSIGLVADTPTSNNGGVYVDHWRVWSDAKSSGGLDTERVSAAAADATNLLSDSPLPDTGTLNVFSLTGTLSNGSDSPYIVAGWNTSGTGPRSYPLPGGGPTGAGSSDSWIRGTATSAGSAALTGVAGTGAAGTAVGANTHAVSGVAGTGALGAVSASQRLTGTAGSGAPGTLTPSDAKALSGLAASGSAGTLASAATVPLSGLAASGSPGTLTPTNAEALSGTAASGAVGTTAGALSKALVGEAASGSVGSAPAALDVPLSGLQATGAAGNVDVPAGGSVAVTGVEASSAAGAVGAAPGLQGTAASGSVGTSAPTLAVPLGGSSAAATAGSVSVAGGAASSGEAAPLPIFSSNLQTLARGGERAPFPHFESLFLPSEETSIVANYDNGVPEAWQADIGFAAAYAPQAIGTPVGNSVPAFEYPLTGLEGVGAAGTVGAEVSSAQGGNAAPLPMLGMIMQLISLSPYLPQADFGLPTYWQADIGLNAAYVRQAIGTPLDNMGGDASASLTGVQGSGQLGNVGGVAESAQGGNAAPLPSLGLNFQLISLAPYLPQADFGLPTYWQADIGFAALFSPQMLGMPCGNNTGSDVTVGLSGVSASAVAQQVSGLIEKALAGAAAAAFVGRLRAQATHGWSGVDDSQTCVWGHTAPTPSPWTPVDDSQSGGWGSTPDDAEDWVPVDDGQTSPWS